MEFKSHGNRPHGPTTELLASLKGIELGGAQGEGPTGNSFFIDAINVAPQWSEEIYYNKDPEGRGKIDLCGHAGDIPLLDNRADFVISSHVLEHVPNPIAAFREWNRVVRPGGYVLMIVPLPDAMPSDVRRVTPHWDFVKALRENWTWDSHPQGYPHNGKYGHYWKFEPLQLKLMIDYWVPAWTLVKEESPDSKVGNGFFLAYQLPQKTDEVHDSGAQSASREGVSSV